MNSHKKLGNFECIFFETNLRKKLTLCRGNPRKENIANFLDYVGTSWDHYIGKYDNIFIMGDFNSESTDTELTGFCETYNFTNLIKEPTCFKNPLNPSSVDLLLTEVCHLKTAKLLKLVFLIVTK